MSYHNIPSSARQSTTNAQGQTAPVGFHYMPDGTLMSDIEHAKLYNKKIIRSFNLDFNDIKAAGETRPFTIIGDNEAVFSLEIKNEDNYYYNFQTNLFQATKTKLSNISINGGAYKGTIVFPTVTDADKYDFYLFAIDSENTKHSEYREVRFDDDSLDINSSTGSNSNFIQKVIYQTLDTTITINGYSPTGIVTGTNTTSATITTSRNKRVTKIPFTHVFTVTSTRTLAINAQPTANSIMTYVTRTIGSNPINISGEDIYPTVTAADKVVNGAVGSGTNVTMDDDFTGLWAVGDKITGNTALDARTQDTAVTVTAVNVGSNAKVFTMSEAIEIADDETLSFSNRRNYRWSVDDIDGLQNGMRTIASTFFANPPTIKDYINQITIFEGEANEYKIDNVTVPGLDTLGAKPSITRNATTNVIRTIQTGNIVFSDQALFSFASTTPNIYGYGVNEINYLTGYDVEFSDLNAALTTVSTTTTAVVNSSASVPITARDGIMNGISTVSGIGINPTISGVDTINGAVSGATRIVMDTNVIDIMSAGDVVTGNGIDPSSTVTVLALDPDGDNAKEFSVSEAVSISDNAVLSFRNPTNSSPSIVSGAASVSGAGTIVLSAPQTLENGITLTFPGAGTVVTITGYIKVNKTGNSDITLMFDLEKFLTMH